VTAREALESLFAAWRDGDAHRASAHFAGDAVYREARHDALHGREAIFQHFVTFFRDGPAFRFEADDLIVEGERAAVLYRFRVETRGEWTEKTGAAIVRFDRGAITEWREFDG